jgi:DNA-binding NtrC family response regulator
MTDATPGFEPGCVLLVDDDPDLLYTVKLFLELDGHRVVTTTNVSEALVALDREPVDVVVTDLVLPGLSGIDLLTALRRARETVEVVLVTGHADVSSATDALRQRAFDYLAKPVTGLTMRQTVRRALEARRHRDEAERDAERSQHKVTELAKAVKERTAELQTSRERYQALVESLPILIAELDVATGSFTYLGGALQARILALFDGQRPAKLLDLIHHSERPRIAEVAKKMTRGGTLDIPMEVPVGPDDREPIWLRTASIRGEEGGRLAFVALDTTEQRRAEAERARLEKELANARAELEANLIGQLDLKVGSPARLVERATSVAPPAGAEAFGRSAAMRHVEELARLASAHDQPVLILGETGTGKGVVARFIHDLSGRAPLVSINCSSLRGELLDAELFGHARGAFTSAVKERRGLVEEASGGTLFLDEIGETTPETQARLLKLLEERTFRRVGETRERSSDFRLICATNRDLAAETASGRFRRDLLYRINLFTLDLPPLRKRRSDLRWLVPRLLESLGAAHVELSPSTWSLLERYDFPGNVRELRNALIRATLLARGNPLAPEHFLEIARAVSPDGSSSDSPATAEDVDDSEDERAYIASLLARFDGNRSKVARKLGISRTTLYKKLKAHGLLDDTT